MLMNAYCESESLCFISGVDGVRKNPFIYFANT